MKKVLPKIILGTFLVSGSILCGAESAQRRLGDAAFYAGDYRNAISSYESAMSEALRNNDPDEWADCALNLGVAYLHHGELAKAKELLAEFRRRHPLRSTGTLEGDLLAAEGKYDAAEHFFTELRTNDPVSEDARLFSLAMLYMNTGRTVQAYELFIRISGRIGIEWPAWETDAVQEALLSGQTAEAHRIVGRLTARPETPWRRYAVREAIYALIQLKRFDQAQAIIAQLPADWRDADIELLTYLTAVNQGRTDDFKQNLNSFLEKMPQQPHTRLFELFSKAAEAAGKAQDHQFAADLLTNAIVFTADARIKQELHRQLLTHLLNFSPDRSAEAAESFYRNYPQAADRLTVVFNAAGILFNRKSYAQAMRLYTFLTDNTAGSQGDTAAMRLEAAANAAVCAEQLKNFTALEKSIRILVNESAQSSLWQCRYAAFLEQNERVDAAANELRDAYNRAKNANRPADAEKCAFLLLEFGIRRNDPAMIREFATLLNNSQIPEYAATAKMELGQLLENASLFRQARRYFQEAARLQVEKYTAMAAFKAVLMAYKDSDFPTAETAMEFLEFATNHPDYDKTPEALFVAVELFDLAADRENSRRAAAILREKYSSTPAFAVLILRQAAKYDTEQNIGDLIRDLRTIETQFRGETYAAEAALLRAVFTAQTGKNDEALQILSALHTSQNKQLAAESFMRAGEILFRQGKLTEAKAAFLRCAALLPGTLPGENAMLRAGDCDLAAKMPIDLTNLTDCIARFAQLSNNSNFPQIRLEAFYKNGIALEHADKPAEALSCYEKAIYTAVAMREQNLYPDEYWCVRSCEAALRLIAETGQPGALQRGMQLIDQADKVMQDKAVVAAMRESYRKQFTRR